MTTTDLHTARTALWGVTIRALGDEPEITITTPTTDYLGDSIDPEGMDTSRYMAGPRAVKFTHGRDTLPVGKTLTLATSAKGIRAKFKWLDVNPEARLVREVFQEGVLGASIEFIPIGDPVAKRDGGYRFPKSTLSGWVLTPDPANPECIRMLKSLALRRPAAEEIDLSMLTRGDVVTALREAIGVQAQGAVASAVARWQRGDDVIDLENIPYGAEPDVLAGLTRGDVVAALREAVAESAAAGVRRAVNLARGRVD